MEQKRMRIIVGFTSAMFAVLFIMASEIHAVNDDGRWTSVLGNRTWFVNTKTMVAPAPGIVSLWEKKVLNKRGRTFGIVRDILLEEGVEHRNFRYIQSLKEVDCKGGKYRTVTILFYDKDDRILYASIDPEADWKTVDPFKKSGDLSAFVCSGFVFRTDEPVMTAREGYSERRNSFESWR